LMPTFVRERRAALHTFVNELLRSGKYAKSTLVMDFFAGTSQTTDHAPGQADAIRTIVPGPAVCTFGSGGTIIGYTAPSWDLVRHAFESNFANGGEAGAQCVIYRGGEKVVDLVGSNAMADGYTADTLQGVYSSGKNLEGVAIAMMVDQKVFDYNDKVTAYWPAFGAHGKDLVSITDVLRHEAGTPFFSDPSDISDYTKDATIDLTELTDVAKVEKLIEGSGMCRQGGQRSYHAVTRGQILNGIVRRTDPKERSLATYIDEEITAKLDVAVVTSVPMSETSKHDIAECRMMSPAYNVAFKALPALAGMTRDGCSAQIFKMLRNKKSHFSRARQSITGTAGKKPSDPENLAAGSTSAGINSNARSLAIVNAVMANGGALNGVRLLSEEACAASMAKVKIENDAFFGMKTGLSQAGFCAFDTFDTCPYNPYLETKALKGFVGWSGYGGSFSVWNPEKQIAFAYTCTAISNDLVGGTRSTRSAPATVCCHCRRCSALLLTQT